MTTRNLPGITTDAEGYTPIIASLVALLLTQATWVVSFSNTTQAVHGPIQWQIYGSGPSLAWEWVSGAILGGIMLIVLADLICLTWKRYGGGKWMNPGTPLEAMPQKTPDVEMQSLRSNRED